MSLPFEKDGGKSKITCFVCGKIHQTYEEYKSHIIENHEEGREYILCPLERCKFPVRDVRSHFKAKHPAETIPKTGQLKCIVWKDFSHGKVKTRKLSFKQGYFISNKMNGRALFYRSGWECQVYECLEDIPEVISYEAEPFKWGIPYFFEGKMHHYFPDISVKMSDGTVHILEIKPISQTALGVNKAKWNAATQFCEHRGWDFVVITEYGIEKLKTLAKQNKINHKST